MSDIIQIKYVGGPDDGDIEEVDHDVIRRLIKGGDTIAVVYDESTGKDVICRSGFYTLQKIDQADYEYRWKPKKGQS